MKFRAYSLYPSAEYSTSCVVPIGSPGRISLRLRENLDVVVWQDYDDFKEDYLNSQYNLIRNSRIMERGCCGLVIDTWQDSVIRRVEHEEVCKETGHAIETHSLLREDFGFALFFMQDGGLYWIDAYELENLIPSS